MLVVAAHSDQQLTIGREGRGADRAFLERVYIPNREPWARVRNRRCHLPRARELAVRVKAHAGDIVRVRFEVALPPRLGFVDYGHGRSTVDQPIVVRHAQVGRLVKCPQSVVAVHVRPLEVYGGQGGRARHQGGIEVRWHVGGGVGGP
eukprot:scaffold116286_cov69-Phaeocystis_antarctica.AAC.1